ncbi:hypothetical protein Tco_0145344 [Tanacetum coccineum]
MLTVPVCQTMNVYHVGFEMLPAPPSPDYVPGPEEPEQAPPSLDFSSLRPEDPEEDNEDPEEDPADYPTNRNDKEEEEEKSSRDYADDEEEDEEEHLALADSILPPACHFVMSDSEDSTVTYNGVLVPFEDLSDIGSPGVDELPMMPEDPYAYVEAAL